MSDLRSPRFDGAYCSTEPLTGEMKLGMLERSSGYLWWQYSFRSDGRLCSDPLITATAAFPSSVENTADSASAKWEKQGGEIAITSLIDPFHEDGSAQARITDDGKLTFASGATCKFVPFTA